MISVVVESRGISGRNVVCYTANISNGTTVATVMRPSGRGRALAVLLVVYILSDILLTPLGGS